MGCGRTGALLAADFADRGHSIAVIDQDPDAFRRLPRSFDGQTVTGMGFDRDTLVSAGIEEAYAFAAVSSGDNSNILAARVVRETYGVDNVVARIADPDRAEVYRRLGITTVAPVEWTTAQIVSRLLPGGTDEAFVDHAAGMAVLRVNLNPGWTGRTVAQVEKITGAHVSYLTRFGHGMLPDSHTTLQSSDDLYIAVRVDDQAAAVRVLSRPPGDLS